MKSNHLKSIIITLIALIFPFLQQHTYAQTSKFEAQLKLYEIAQSMSEGTKSVDYGTMYFENISYDASTLRWDAVVTMKNSDVRLLSTDMLTLMIYNTINQPDKKQIFTELLTLLQIAESNWELTYRDIYGNKISLTLTPNDFNDLLTKSLDELGIDKEQMSNYCIFYHNQLAQRDVDGIVTLKAKASKEGKFVKLSYHIVNDPTLTSRLTPESIKSTYIKSFGTELAAKSYTNQLEAFGFDGIILEYIPDENISITVPITINDIASYFSTHDISEACDTIDSTYSYSSLSDNPRIQQIIKDYELEYKKDIGVDGVVDVQVKITGLYLEINKILDEVNDNAAYYDPDVIKSELYNNYSINEAALSELVRLQNEGLRGFIFSFTNLHNRFKTSVYIDFEDAIALSQYNNGIGVDELESLTDTEKKELQDAYMQSVEQSAKESISTDGITNAHVYIAGGYATILFTLQDIAEISEYELAQLKADMIQQFRSDYNLTQTLPIIKYATEITGIRHIYKAENSYKSATITIDFEEIIGNNLNDYADSYDFSEKSTDNILNELILDFETGLKQSIGVNGLIDAKATLTDNILETTFIFDSSVNVNNISDINDLKNQILLEVTATQEDLDTWGALYYLGIYGLKFTFKNEGNPSGKWFTITIEDVINGIDNLDNIPLNEI